MRLAVNSVMVGQALERLLHPVPVPGIVPLALGLLAAAANWGVARLLVEPGGRNPTIRLAYLHNLGEVLVSLALVAADSLIALMGRSFIDPQPPC